MSLSGRSVALFAVVAALSIPAAGQAPSPPASGASRAVSEALRQRLEQMEAAKQPAGGRAQLAAQKALPVIYEEAGYQPFWTAERVEMLLALVRESSEDGLRPADYHLAELEKLGPSLAAPSTDAVSRAQIDLLATDAFYLLLYHLYVGKVDPVSLDPTWNFEPRPIREGGGVKFVLGALTSGKLKEAVAAVRPDHWWYAKARAALAEYRAIQAKGGWAPVPAGPTLKLGTSGPRVVALRRRLAATGDLSGQPLDAPAFDEPLAAAVRAFQTRHRLAPEGSVGAATLAELNVPIEARILQIRVNLERGRWVLHEIPKGPIVLVDVAGFQTVYARDGEVKWRTKVQVGKPYRQTPIFKSKIDNVVFNPTWTVPPGILAKDILPAVKRDRGYLAKKNLEVIDANGRTVDPATIDWSKVSADRFPYMLRQAPGPDNALGRVKLLFPNSYSVYLHDTPHKELFEKDARAFSSGCMRVERPLELARLVLDDPAWTEPAIAKVIEGGETRTVRLPKPVPVLIMYWTIDPTVAGRTVFKRDPYGRDARVGRALDAALSSVPLPRSR